MLIQPIIAIEKGNNGFLISVYTNHYTIRPFYLLKGGIEDILLYPKSGGRRSSLLVLLLYKDLSLLLEYI
jgi:hypothetical protein